MAWLDLGWLDDANDGGVLFVVLLNILLGGLLLLVHRCLLRSKAKSTSQKEKGLLQRHRHTVVLDEDVSPADSTDHDNSNNDPAVPRVQNIRRVFSLTDAYLVRHYGRDTLLYVRFLRLLIVFMAFASVTSFFVTLPINRQGTEGQLGIYATTINNIARQSDLLWVHLALTYIVSIGVFLVIAGFQSLSREWKRSATEEMEHPSTATPPPVSSMVVMVQGVPTTGVDDVFLYDYLRKRYGDEVFGVYSVPDLAGAMRANNARIRAQKNLDYNRVISQHRNARPIVVQCCPFPQIHGAVAFYQAQVIQFSTKVQSLLCAERHGTGFVFVVFRRPASARRFLRDMHSLNRPVLFPEVDRPPLANRWRVSPAPEANDILWENLHHGALFRWFRFACINLLLVLISFFFTTPIAITSALWQLSFLAPKLSTFFRSLLRGPVFYAFMPSLILLLIRELLPVVFDALSRYEGFLKESARQRSNTIKTFIYYLLNILILPSLWFTSLFSLAERTASSPDAVQWVAGTYLTHTLASGPFFINYVIQCAFLGEVVDLMRLPDWVIFKYRLARAMTAKDVREAHRTPPFAYSYHYAFILAIFSVVLTYGTTCPLIYPAGFFFFFFKLMVDKWNICTHYARGAQGDGALASTIVTILVLNLLLAQSVMCVFFSERGVSFQFTLSLLLLLLTAGAFLYNWLLLGTDILVKADPIEENTVSPPGSTTPQLLTEGAHLSYIHPLLRTTPNTPGVVQNGV